MAYLEETNATAILEGIIERAISAQPANVTAYVVDELVALNDDVRIPALGRHALNRHVALGQHAHALGASDGDGDSDDVISVGKSSEGEAGLDAEEEALLLDEEEQLLEEEELLADEEEQVVGVTEHLDGGAHPRGGRSRGGGAGLMSPLGPLATLEEDEEEDDDGWQHGVRS